MTDDAVMLELSHVAKLYGDTEVLTDVSLQISAGESLSVVGPSGSGKSTLLNIMGALDAPSSGDVLFAGQSLTDLDEAGLANLRNREIGFVFQLHHLLPQCTVLENVLTPTLVAAADDGQEEPETRARRLLDRVGLGDRLEHRPAQLSGGEQQRVAVVRALINEPRLVLADEPTGSLDRQSADRLGDLLVELNRDEGVALVVVTHAEHLAARMSRVLQLRDGRLHPAEASS